MPRFLNVISYVYHNEIIICGRRTDYRSGNYSFNKSCSHPYSLLKVYSLDNVC